MNLQLAIERLRSHLFNQHLEFNNIIYIIESASREIEEKSIDHAASAAQEAMAYAESIGAKEFLNEVTVTPTHAGSYIIGTISGRLDYSTPKKEMLGHILGKAKTAKDGSRYQSVPFRDNSSTNKMPISTAADAQMQQNRAHAIRENLRSAASSRRTAILESMRQANSIQGNNSPVTSFRTASSKQSPSESWVIPEKNADMTEWIIQRNNMLELDILNTIDSTIQAYIDQYSE